VSRIAGVIQARMGSTRVPGKALMPLAGKPLVWHMVDRLRRTEICEQIVLATTVDPRNEPLIAFATDQGLEVVVEDKEDDLAGRIARAARRSGADYLLKTGGDCPLIDPDVMRGMVDLAVRTQADFCSNRVRWTFPLGLSCDVVSSRAVLWCDENLTRPEDRELFALYLRDHPDDFVVRSYENDVDLSDLGWTVDTPEDYELMSDVFSALYREGSCFGMNDVLRYLKDDRALP
jgi:spore coat polysaccharide biosynthesis protein SpsF